MKHFNHLPVTKSSLFGIALGCVFIVQMIGNSLGISNEYSEAFMLNIEQFWSVLQPLIILGITAGVVLAVIFGSIRIGWKFAPWIVVLGLLILFLN